MHGNRLRKLLDADQPSLRTQILISWPSITTRTTVHRIRITVFMTFCCLFGFSRGTSAENVTLTYDDLIQRLVDLEALSVLPNPGEKCAQESSTDRRCRFDVERDVYLDWDANLDNGQSITRMENGKVVLAEMAGPGCIWRIWSGEPARKNVQMILDGADVPALDLPFKQYFDGTAEKWPPISNRKIEYPPGADPKVSANLRTEIIGPVKGSALYHNASSGWNCYIPIPFQKSCKILADPWIPPYNRDGWGMFFTFTHSRFPEGTVVPTFTGDLAPEDRRALDAVNDFLAQCGADPAGQRPGQEFIARRIEVKPGETTTLADIQGARAITTLKIKPSLPKHPADRDVLRKLALQITWDDDAKPSVWSPLGDFFGTSPGLNKYRSLPLGMTDDGIYSYWYMPFATRGRVELINDDTKAHDVSFSITHAPLTRPIEQLGRFHAKWHGDTGMDPKRPFDWPMLRTRGRGRFCGVLLNIWNPVRGWWGEGDEKFFVDGEKYPSTFGTGSEDYFGYAWANRVPFQNAFHSQTVSLDRSLKDTGAHELQSLNRWHIADNVPFQTSFEACIEKFRPNFFPTRYNAVSYWYLAPGGDDPYDSVAVEERMKYMNQPDIPAAERFGYFTKKAYDRPIEVGEPNVARHGNCEEWNANQPLGWGTYTGGGVPTISKESSAPYVTAGKHAIKIHAQPAVCGLMKVDRVEPLSAYKVMVDTTVVSGKAKIQINMNDIGVLWGFFLEDGGPKTTEFIVTAGTKASQMDVFIMGVEKNTLFYIDNFRIYKIADLQAD